MFKTDNVLFDAALTHPEETVPQELVKSLIGGENPVRVWRRHRKLTQRQLAESASITEGYLSQIENGQRTGSSKVLAGLASALKISIDDLID